MTMSLIIIVSQNSRFETKRKIKNLHIVDSVIQLHKYDTSGVKYRGTCQVEV